MADHEIMFYQCLSNDGTTMEVKRITPTSISLSVGRRGASFSIGIHNRDARRLRRQLKRLLKDLKDVPSNDR